ncbi:hypothetical protein [Campylobacter troglodytis]|uniref:hypothetical protein n=1 Tax=Campylobacter troglodytis TaxID=654363 RepID=UPI001156E9E0|nr:hypothetical protein [Campylobacter troglodytis]TQR55794.1 hypothetical protein DMC01_09625 [Campylobacter troglodytis]
MKFKFEIHLSGIILKEIEKESKGKITKDTPIFCYNQHSQETSIAKLEDSAMTIKTNLSKDLINQAKENLIKPCFLNLSFIPLINKNEANNKASQKIQLTNDDINRGYITVEFKVLLRFLGEWEGIGHSKDGKNQGEYNQAFQIVDDNGCGLPNIPYKISTECGIEYEGITDNNGYTQRIYTQNAQNLNIEILG